MDITEKDVSEENPILGKYGNYGDDCFYYTAEVRDEELTPKIKEATDKIKALELGRKKLIDALIAKVDKPKKWEVSLKKLYEYGGIDVMIHKTVYKEKKPLPPPTIVEKPAKPEATKLEKLLHVLDAKTLFNSGILTKEEKRELLGLGKDAAK